MKAMFYLPIFIACLSLNLNAQYAVDAAGSYFKNGSYSAAFAIGEVSSITIRGSQSTFLSTTGVIQPDPLTITGTKDPGIQTIRIYPNPVSDFLKLETGRSEIILFEIYSMQGVFLSKGSVTGMSLNLNYLSPGLYLISFFRPGFHEHQTFLISKI